MNRQVLVKLFKFRYLVPWSFSRGRYGSELFKYRSTFVLYNGKLFEKLSFYWRRSSLLCNLQFSIFPVIFQNYGKRVLTCCSSCISLCRLGNSGIIFRITILIDRYIFSSAIGDFKIIINFGLHDMQSIMKLLKTCIIIVEIGY